MTQIESIEIHSVIYDSKIDAYNIAFEMSKNDYLIIANDIKNNNELQRKRVKMASSVYSLMKEDLKQGCLIPPIVLSLDKEDNGIDEDLQTKNIKNIANYIVKNYKKIRILDGLQRTNMLLEVDNELKKLNSNATYETKFYEKKLRFEMYLGISRFGILYRMLTLNTGQTPMSLRHQVEILYSDLYVVETEGIRLIRETDTNKKVGVGKYHFNDMIEGLESYLQGDELPLDRFDILEYVKGLKAMSEKDKKSDLFKDFVKLYHDFITKIALLFNNIEFDAETLSAELSSYLQDSEIDKKEIKPFGKNMVEIFTTSQAITGFGAAICKQNIDKVSEDIKKIAIAADANEVLNSLVIRLVVTTNSARRIGNNQRLFFRDFFESLFKDFIIDKAIEKAFKTSRYKLDN